MSKKGRNLADLIGGFEDEPQEAAPANEPANDRTAAHRPTECFGRYRGPAPDASAIA